ncbi:GNAT family N-acetyltransferase [Pseudaminobacter soli (ex Li et al. 2025)]|uniref:GNAT family N-acetyltransferase n=1 Tax=Pseudaminobacter soli (ex Li et al. 2025) TaxID=1295366 RepID=A0A2P7SAA0_9HYPH|nr:GNAT family N-acetyltransferase [Mesorhizobium soli]PSJ59424.1 GNAT family N-acetyltransferase [Mesorhizobium soli]
MVDLLVTYMEMTHPPEGAALSVPAAAASIGRETLTPEDYLALYRAVGAPLNWDHRLRMPSDQLRDFLGDCATHVYVLRLDGRAVGLCEFEGVGRREVELVHFGLSPEVQGQKLGPWLLDRALREIWSHGPSRVWLHTDTWDHPKAKSVYQRAGFHTFAERMETFPD